MTDPRSRGVGATGDTQTQDAPEKPDTEVQSGNSRPWLSDVGGAASESGGMPPPHMSLSVPERYEVRESEDGTFLHCDDAPRVRVCIDPKKSFSEADARALGDRNIFLDGAGDFAPKLDNKARLYNLDHHQGCIRPFTLAACEQALIVVMNGLELDEGDWTLYVNEPDLDTLFAVWVLLNFRRIPKLSSRSKDTLLPLLRLEGAIDANGAELSDYCGLTQNTLRGARERLDTLYTLEKEYRAKERWADLDMRGYTAAMLGELDQLVYTHADFQDHTSIGEILGHLEIADRKVAVACRDQSGIYEAERSLKNRFGDQLGIILLEKTSDDGVRHYTLRRVSALLNFDLAPAYDVLNMLDPAVNGRPSGNRWGGSDDIGGSPRTSGTKLAPNEVLRLLERAYQRKSKRQKTWPWFAASAMTASLFVVASVTAFIASSVPGLRTGLFESLTMGGVGLAAMSLVTLAFALPTTMSGSERRPWLYGWRRPAGHDWLYVVPVVIAATIPANALAPHGLSDEPAVLAIALGVALLDALATEAWFRGVVHGWFLFRGPVQRVDGPWMLSRAASVSSFLYMLVYVMVACAWNITESNPFPQSPIELASIAAAALAGGVALAMIRERSLSIWPGVGAQLLGAVIAVGLAMIGFSLF